MQLPPFHHSSLHQPSFFDTSSQNQCSSKASYQQYPSVSFARYVRLPSHNTMVFHSIINYIGHGCLFLSPSVWNTLPMCTRYKDEKNTQTNCADTEHEHSHGGSRQ